jgi:hypothetical protein
LDAIRFSVGVFGASIDALSDPVFALASVAADVAFFAFFAFFAARRRARASSVSVSRAASRFRAFPSLARVVVVVVDIAIGIRARLVSPRLQCATRRRRRRRDRDGARGDDAGGSGEKASTAIDARATGARTTDATRERRGRTVKRTGFGGGGEATGRRRLDLI